MSRRGVSLEEISEDYPIILIDTCALIGYQEKFSGTVNSEGYSAHFFRKCIDDGAGIYVTSSVFREYSKADSLIYIRDLLDVIQSNSRILELDKDERKLYSKMSIKYDRIKDKFGLGNTDYDLLVSAVVLSEVRKEPIALISNDMGILRGWKFFLMEEDLSLDELRFLIRIGNETFKKMKPPKNYKKI